MNEDVLIAIYGILQTSLRSSGLLGEYGQPLTSKHLDEEDRTTIELYRWLAERLRRITEGTLNRRKEVFNAHVRQLEQEYLLNNFILALFLFETELGEFGTTPEKIVLMPKLNRLIKLMRVGIIALAEENGDNGISIVRDSKIAASNIARLFRGEPEITKKMREYKAQKWRRDAARKYTEAHR